jgi:hypothetical protein
MLLGKCMADSVLDLIRDIEREIEADKKALAEKEAGLRLLKGRLSMTHAPATPPQAPAQSLAPDDLFDLSALEISQGQRRRTFVDDLKDSVKRFGHQEFNIAHVEAALKRLGIEVAGKTPRSRISASLSRLWDEGFLVRTFAGSGNVPNRFRVAEFVPASDRGRYTEANRRDHAADDGADDGADAGVDDQSQ